MLPAGPDITNFIDREALLLDTRRFDDWLGLFTEDAWYWIPLTPDQEGPLDGPSHVYETRDALLARIYRLKDPQNFPQQPPSRCCRLMGRPFIIAAEGAAAAGADMVARASFQLVELLPHRDADEGLRHFAGTITYGLVGTGADLSIRWRRVDLINSEKGMHGVSILL